MKIFKFGGASVKNAKGVKNMIHILRSVGYENTLLIVSAMGKITNALEEVINNYITKSIKLNDSVSYIKDFHDSISKELFGTDDDIFEKVEVLFNELSYFLENNTSEDKSFIYDQIICFGELFSTTIISKYLQKVGIQNDWIDVRTVFKTDNQYRNATVNWKLTEELVNSTINTNTLNITQGFIASDLEGNTTTLGREGSDFSAAIMANCLNAKDVTIWKDVEGVLNADPRHFNKTKLLKQIPYEEAIELAFYGASVIHPKTLKPLQNKNIPLFVKSFLNLSKKGTVISNFDTIKPIIPCYIIKKTLVLVSIFTSDSSFIVEKNISYIFKVLHDLRFEVEVIQNSAISFSICINNKFDNLERLIHILNKNFKVQYHENVSLYTIRHTRGRHIKALEKDKLMLLKQRLGDTFQFITKEE